MRPLTHCSLGQPRVHLGQLGSQRRWRIRRHPHQRARPSARPDPSLPRTHCCRPRHRLVRSHIRWDGRRTALIIPQESLQRLAHFLGLRRWQGLHLEGARGLHAAHGCGRARRCCARRQAERTHEVRLRALSSDIASNRRTGKSVTFFSTLPPKMSLLARRATTP
jgi:hypothetical protein